MSLKYWRRWDWGYAVKWLSIVGSFFAAELWLVWQIVAQL